MSPRALLLAAALTALWPCGAHAQGLQPGAVVEGVVQLAGKQIPLPEGPWVVVGVGHQPWAGAGAFGAIANVVLLRLQGVVVDAMAELNVNELPVTDGWGLAADCQRRDLALVIVRYQTGWDGSCFFVTHTLATTPTLTAAWSEAVRFAADADLVVAPVWLTAGFRVSSRRDVIDARFHFSPTLRGIPVEVVADWSASDWHAARLARDPRRVAVGGAVARWAATYGGLLEAGLKNRLAPDLMLPMPGTPAMAGQDDPLQSRLAALAAQRDAGLVSEPQYRRQVRWLHEHGLQANSATVGATTVALAKSLTYQPLMTLASLGMGLLGGAQTVAGGAVGLFRAGLDSAVFYLHELGWERFGGKVRRDSARTLDFRYFGSDT